MGLTSVLKNLYYDDVMGTESMKVFAIGCHPDDLEIACGGTLRKYADQGADVYMCHVASGNMGHVEILPPELASIREEEAKTAGAILGAKEVFTLRADDTYVVQNNEDLVDGLTELIRFTDPDVIITHGDNDYMRDHVEVGNLAFNASFVASIVHRATASAASGIAPIFYMDNLAGMDFIPTHYVDISSTIETKLQALAAHETQITWMADHDKIDFVEFVRSCSRVRGLQSSVTYAEGFRPCLRWPRVSTKNLLP